MTTPLISSLSGGTDLPRPDTSRLRATWLRDYAARLGLATFMAAAGITCSQRLGDLITAQIEVLLPIGFPPKTRRRRRKTLTSLAAGS